MATVVDDALNTDEVLAGNAVVSHEFLDVDTAEVAPLEHFLLFNRIV
jgi:hypothetical protein